MRRRKFLMSRSISSIVNTGPSLKSLASQESYKTKVKSGLTTLIFCLFVFVVVILRQKTQATENSAVGTFQDPRKYKQSRHCFMLIFPFSVVKFLEGECFNIRIQF